jgi:hypothetical protein
MGGGAIASKRCSFIREGGERCKRIASEGYEYCYSHDPNRSAERSRNAAKAGRKGGNGRSGLDETAQARKYIRGLITQLLSGGVQREIATACFMGLNVLARYIELERKIFETVELEERILMLEQRDRAKANKSTWQTHRG